MTARPNRPVYLDNQATTRCDPRVLEIMLPFFSERYGLPPITGRILGWLMICDPPEQSAEEIARAIGASRASLTTNMRLLTGGGLVHRLTRSGGRTAYYRIDDDAWEKVIRQRVESMMAFGKIAEQGIQSGRSSSEQGYGFIQIVSHADVMISSCRRMRRRGLGAPHRECRRDS